MMGLEVLALAAFLLSTPVAAAAVFGFGADREIWALINSYCFSSGYCLLYVCPLLLEKGGLERRLHKAQMHWVIWLTVFTELLFQIPHNLWCAGIGRQP